MEDVAMEVDDDTYMNSSQSRGPNVKFINLVHEQTIDHFSLLLHELASARSQASSKSRSRQKGGLYSSIHAPRSACPVIDESEYVGTWSTRDCIQYLCRENSLGKRNSCMGDPAFNRLANFLTPAYTPGGRRGDEWSIPDWMSSLVSLKKLANYWEDLPILNGVDILESLLKDHPTFQ